MDSMNNNGPVRHKIKKVKRPVKRPVSGSPDNLSVPQKAAESPFGSSSWQLQGGPAMTVSAAMNDPYVPVSASAPAPAPTAPEPQPEKMDAFSLDAFLDNDNLPALQQDTRLQQNNFERSFVRDEDVTPPPPSWKDKMVVGDLYTGFAVFVTAAVFLLFGIMFTKIFLSGPTTVQNGLQGVVINSEVPRGRARCGVAEKTQGCVLYIMNPQRQDLNGRDFYDLAAQLTGRQRFMIETGNMRYSSIKIKPGEIAQLNIPPLQ